MDLLQADEQLRLPHDELEVLVQREGGEVLRLLLQGHFALRSSRVSAGPVVGADGVERTHRRVRAVLLKTVVGKVEVPREVRGARGRTSLAPADAEVNLPREVYLFGVQKRVTVEAAEARSMKRLRASSAAQRRR